MIDISKLDKVQVKILKLLCRNLSHYKIAKILGISDGKSAYMVRLIYQTLGINGKKELFELLKNKHGISSSRG